MVGYRPCKAQEKVKRERQEEKERRGVQTQLTRYERARIIATLSLTPKRTIGRCERAENVRLFDDVQ